MPSLAQESLLLFGGQSYIQKIANIQRSNLIALWPQNEGSGTVITDLSPEANNGAYTGVTWDGTKGPDGGSPVPYYDGANDYGNVYSAAFNTDFVGGYGAIAGWFKVAGASVWTDGIARNMVYFKVDVNNYVRVGKSNANNAFFAIYAAGGTVKSALEPSYSPTVWIPIVMNFKDSGNGDRLQLFLSGVQVGADVTGNGAYVGSLGSTTTVLGAATTGATEVWNGYLGPVAVWKSYNLTAADIAAWGTV